MNPLDALSYAVAFVPVLAFLAALRLMDTYRLVPRQRVLSSLAAGAMAAIVCYFLNGAILDLAPDRSGELARFSAPVIEELAKSTMWIFLVATARVAFLVDAGICAFAVGAGFSLVENFSYLQEPVTHGLAVSTLRGFGTAVMHGGVASIGAILTVFVSERRGWQGWRMFLPGLAAAIGIHSLFNQGLLPPAASAAVMLVTMPLLISGVFLWGESSLRSWLGDKLDRDIELLNMIAMGELHKTRAGAYLQSLQDSFPPAIRGDMLCMLQLTIELSVRAKGDMLMREAGLVAPPDEEVEAQFTELAYLEKSIGRTGMLAIRPLLSQSRKELWEMRRLARKQ
ncbi:MAG: PrsW family intramembrane metalloprotease [Methylotetracoccus sp.]|nr:PrsW family intramembrane metalloprotease [Methylotetracoccus sp.]